MTVRVQRSAAFEPLEHVLRDFETALPRLPEAVIPRAARRRAAEQLRQLGWPQTRDEQWRYLNLRAYERVDSFAPAEPREHSGVRSAHRDVSAPPSLEALEALEVIEGITLPPALPGFERLIYLDGVHVDGRLASAAVHTPAAYPGAVALPSRSLEPWSPEQRLAFLTDMFAQDTATLSIDGEAAIELLYVSSARADGAAVYPRLHLELAADSRVTLVERHLGAKDTAVLVCASATVEIARCARLTHYLLQQCAVEALFSATLSARVQEGASYRLRQIALGAASARTSTRIRLAGRAAALDWQGIGVGCGEQVQDNVLEVEHGAPATQTEEVFRGIADERARVAFSAHIHIESAAAGSQARQSLRGLIEAQGEVDLRPRLEIHTDEVSAQHGATTGRLDENLMFYLLSRGIDRSTARTLLKWAFLNDVLRQIELPQLRSEAARSAAGRLQDVFAVGAVS